MITELIKLIWVHALADFALQPEAMALGKGRKTNPLKGIVPWGYWLTSHSMIQGLGVYVVTGSLALGIAETVAHWFIDLGKCEGWYGIHADQLLHVACKTIWVALLSM